MSASSAASTASVSVRATATLPRQGVRERGIVAGAARPVERALADLHRLGAAVLAETHIRQVEQALGPPARVVELIEDREGLQRRCGGVLPARVLIELDRAPPQCPRAQERRRRLEREGGVDPALALGRLVEPQVFVERHREPQRRLRRPRFQRPVPRRPEIVELRRDLGSGVGRAAAMQLLGAALGEGRVILGVAPSDARCGVAARGEPLARKRPHGLEHAQPRARAYQQLLVQELLEHVG